MGCTDTVPFRFGQKQTPRSDSANLEISEPIFNPQILEPRLAFESRRLTAIHAAGVVVDLGDMYKTVMAPAHAVQPHERAKPRLRDKKCERCILAGETEQVDRCHEIAQRRGLVGPWYR